MKLVVLSSRFPYPLEKGDKLRLYYQLKELSQDYQIILISITDEIVADEHIKHIKKYCHKVIIFYNNKIQIIGNLIAGVFRNLPLQLSYFYNKKLQRKINEILAHEQVDHIFCQLIRMAPYVQHVSLPKTIDYMDTFSAGMERRAKESSVFLRPFLQYEARQLQNYETAVFPYFNHHTIISEQDKALLKIKNGHRIKVVPNGVDTSFFSPSKSISPSYELVFVGNMGYYPNVKAVLWLAQEVMPKLIQRFPNIRLLIAGARPTKEVQALQSQHIEVSGWLEDIRTAYASAHIFIAPIFGGSGQQNKILEAMAMGLPCITTPLVNNAIGAINNKEILLANTPKIFIENVTLLLQNKNKRLTLSKNGLQFVQQHFSWVNSTKILNKLFSKNITEQVISR